MPVYDSEISRVLLQTYEEIGCWSEGDFEVVFVSLDENEDDFKAFFGTMPWLAVPFSEAKETWHRILVYDSCNTACLIIVDPSGEVLTERGVELVLRSGYGADAFPFTPQGFESVKRQYELARMNQSLTSLLVSKSRDFLLSSDGTQVLVSKLLEKTVGLYFLNSWDEDEKGLPFTTLLLDVYNQLKQRGEQFEVVVVPHKLSADAFKRAFETMPWLCVPFTDRTRDTLRAQFQYKGVSLTWIPIIGPEGKTLSYNADELIQEHGADAYPFTQERINELEKAKQDPQSLESLLVYGGCDFVIGEDGSKVIRPLVVIGFFISFV